MKANKCSVCKEETFVGENLFRNSETFEIVCCECMEQKKIDRKELFPVTRSPNGCWTEYCHKYGYEP